MNTPPEISKRDKLEFVNTRQIMGMGGPWVGDMYLGPRGICKRVLQNNLVHKDKKLYFVQQHDGYFTINYYDIQNHEVFQLDTQLDMAFVDTLSGNKLVYYDAFNNHDGQYRNSLDITQVKHLPLPASDKPEDVPLRYTFEVPPHTSFFSPRATLIAIGVLAVLGAMLLVLSSNTKLFPQFGVLIVVLLGVRGYKGSSVYITRLSVIDDELHVEYLDRNRKRKQTYKLYDIKVYAEIHPRNNYEQTALVISNWKKTQHHFYQTAAGGWTDYHLQMVGDKLSEFTPYTGRKS